MRSSAYQARFNSPIVTGDTVILSGNFEISKVAITAESLSGTDGRERNASVN
jgi:hypothetical protein